MALKSKPKSNLKERLARKKKELAEKGSGKGNIVFPKEGTTRVRILPVGDENEFAIEVTQFYLGAEIKGVFSNSTFGEACPIHDMYKKLSSSKKEADKGIAKVLTPKKKYLMACLVYKDEKGKELDENPVKLVQVSGGAYQDIITYFLDEDEWGDMTDPKKGYDIKIIRVGKGMQDTAYSIAPCKTTSLDKKYDKIYDLEAMVKAVIPDFDEAEEKLASFLSAGSFNDDDDDAPKKKKKVSSDTDDEPIKKKKKKVRK